MCAQDLLWRFMVELTRSEQLSDVRIVGIPSDKTLTQDADFALRVAVPWRADFYTGRLSGLLVDWRGTS